MSAYFFHFEKGDIMKMTAKPALVCGLILILAQAGCFGAGSGGGTVSYLPAMVTASWSGGATGAATDRTDFDPSDPASAICPASSVLLEKGVDGFAGVTLINNCTVTATYYICRTKGSLGGGDLADKECATDPLDTPFSDLLTNTVTSGPPGIFLGDGNTNSIVVLFCGSDELLNILEDPPLRCIGA